MCRQRNTARVIEKAEFADRSVPNHRHDGLAGSDTALNGGFKTHVRDQPEHKPCNGSVGVPAGYAQGFKCYCEKIKKAGILFLVARCVSQRLYKPVNRTESLYAGFGGHRAPDDTSFADKLYVSVIPFVKDDFQQVSCAEQT